MYSLLLRTVLNRTAMSCLLMLLIFTAAFAPAVAYCTRIADLAAADQVDEVGSHTETIAVNFCRVPEHKPARVIAGFVLQSSGCCNLLAVSDFQPRALPSVASSDGLSHFAKRLLCGVLRA